MKTKYTIYLLITLGVLFSCKKEDLNPYRLAQSKASILAGDWTLNSFKVDGIEKRIFIELEKSKHGSCDTQYLTHIDSVYYQQFTFGKKGEYQRKSDIVRIDTSYLPSNITDTACTNKYNFLRAPFDTTIVTKGFWTFPEEVGETPKRERILIFDGKHDRAELWNIIYLGSDEIRLYRKYYDKNDLPVEEELQLLPK